MVPLRAVRRQSCNWRAMNRTSSLPVEENFTRFVSLHWVQPSQLPQLLAQLDATSVDTRKGLNPLWIADEGLTTAQCEFFTDSVRAYLLQPALIASSETIQRNCIVRSWPPNIRDRFGRTLLVRLGHRDIRFRLSACELYIFGTGVVALVLETELAGRPALRDLIEFNYYLRYANPHLAPRFSQSRGSATQPTPSAPTAHPLLSRLRSADGISLPEFASYLLLDVPNAGSVDTLSSLNERTYKTQTFARISSAKDGWPRLEDLSEEVYWLRRAAKDSYEASPEDLQLDDNDSVIRTFDNVAIGCSLEAMATVVVDTGQHPFFQQVAGRMRRSYFAHYLLAVHQRATLLKLALDTASLPHLAPSLTTPSMYSSVRFLRDRASDFNLHHRFVHVSSVTMYAEVYAALTRVLCIPELLQEIHDEVREFNDIIEAYMHAAEARRDRQLNHLVAALGIVALLLSLFSTPFYSRIIQGGVRAPFFVSSAFIVPAVIAGALLMVVAVLHMAERRHDRVDPLRAARRVLVLFRRLLGLKD